MADHKFHNPGTKARDKRAKTHSNQRIKRTIENEKTAFGRARNTVRKYGNLLDAALFPGLGGAQAARDIEAGQSRAAASTPAAARRRISADKGKKAIPGHVLARRLAKGNPYAEIDTRTEGHKRGQRMMDLNRKPDK